MSLLRQWKLQDNAASTVVVDSTGNGNGTLSAVAGNTSAVSQADGPGTALTRSFLLTNASDYVNCTSFLRGTNTTVCAWVKFPVSTAAGFKALVSGTSLGFVFYLHQDATCQLGVYGSNFQDSGYVLTTPSSGWHHIACVSVGISHRWHVDGVAVGSAMTDTLATTIDSFLGDILSNGWRSQTADVRVYDSDESANLATIMAEKNIPGSGGMFFGM